MSQNRKPSVDEEWFATKIDLAKALDNGKVEEVRKFLFELHRDFMHPPRRDGEISGMLFVLEFMKKK